MQDVFDPDKNPSSYGKRRFSITKDIIPYINLGLILVTLLIVLFFVINRKEPTIQTAHSEVPLETVVETLNQRMGTVDQALEALREDLSGLSETTARKIDEQTKELSRREKLERAKGEPSGVSTPQMQVKAKSASAPVKLAAEQMNDFNNLINSDSSDGSAVAAFLDSQTDPAVKSAYLKALKSKGDGWLQAARTSLKSGDEQSAQYCLDNAKYFYSLVNEKGEDQTIANQIAVALAQYDNEKEKKNNEKLLAQQKEELEEQIAAAKEETAALKVELEEKTKHKETATEAARRLEENRRRHAGIKDYKGTSPTPYKTDWDPDPRVREQRGLIRESEKDD